MRLEEFTQRQFEGYKLDGEEPISILIHISDLHFGANRIYYDKKYGSWYRKYKRHKIALIKENPAFKRDLSSLIKKVKKCFGGKIRKIILTGDLTCWGDKESFSHVKSYTGDTNNGLGFNLSDVIVVPGNHDVLKGRFSFNSIFRRNLRREIVLANFRDYFNNWQPNIEYFDLRAGKKGSICYFDSTRKDKITRLNTISGGGIREEQLRDMKDKIEEGGSQFYNSFKIAVLHHHPLPIPEGSTGLKGYYLMLENGPRFVNFLQENGFNMILHGHEHVPCYYSVRYYNSHKRRRDRIYVISAGSCTQDGKQDERSFNLIMFYPSGKFQVIKVKVNFLFENYEYIHFF